MDNERKRVEYLLQRHATRMMNTLALDLKSLRLLKGYKTPEDLENTLDLKPGSIGAAERGDMTALTLCDMIKLSVVLEKIVEVETLLTSSDYFEQYEREQILKKRGEL
ncbi:MAG: hypothetical protein IBX50_11575 [Marinospirillum sp.]|uniref:hypothetical protein n=1 Tax=Marinospirillum sp. TaxID=2183934 RepID=UPI0019F296AD|nr:hypothetical protein [Marinospirillum sp.]MBE0507337.1 hypothetical protein [Marinospirillum sp.]